MIEDKSLLMFRCLIVVFLDFSRCFLIRISVRPDQVSRKPCLIALRRIAAVGQKSAACKYLASSIFEVCARMLFTTFSDCCDPRGTSHIPVFLFLSPLIIFSPLFWMDIACLSSVMVHPSMHKTPNNINGAVYILVKIWICLASLLRPGIWSVAIFVDSIVIKSGSLALISLSIITGAIVGVSCLDMFIFAPESVIASMLVLVGLGGVSIQFTKLILGLLILILLSIAPNRYSHPFSLTPIPFL